MNNFEILQTVFMGFGVIVSVITLVVVSNIGVTQNSINQQALNISDFVEVFLMPQQVIYKASADTVVSQIKWNLLVKNVSAYPIYLNSFTINNIKHDIGNSAIPNQSDSWYGIPISDDVQSKGSFSVSVNFEDYRGKKYMTEGSGIYDGRTWNVTSKKRVEVK